MPGARRESLWLTTSLTLSGVPSSADDRVSRIVPATTSTPSVSPSARQSSQTRNGLPSGQVGDRASELGHAGAEVALGRAANEVGHLVIGKPGQPQADDVIGSAQVGEGLGERRRDIRIGVAEGGQQAEAGLRGAASEVAQQQQRRPVSPVTVFDHQQHRLSSAHLGEQVGNRRMQPVALGVGIGLPR